MSYNPGMKLLCWLALSAHAVLALWVWQAIASACQGDVCHRDAGASVALFGAYLLVPVSIVAVLTLVVIWARERDGNA